MENSNDWHFYQRGLTLLASSNQSDAQSDFQSAIEIAQERLLSNPTDWQNALNLALYLIANAQQEEAQTIIQRILVEQVSEKLISEAVSDFNEYLDIVTHDAVATEIRDRLIDYQSQSSAQP